MVIVIVVVAFVISVVIAELWREKRHNDAAIRRMREHR